jgi:hypothetical protein
MRKRPGMYVGQMNMHGLSVVLRRVAIQMQNQPLFTGRTLMVLKMEL